MKIESFRADGYRNLQNVDIKLHPKLNILCGKNAQGKTNVLEALWLCSGQKSFRGAKDRELINIGRNEFRLALDFSDKRRGQSVSLSAIRNDIKNKKIQLNGVDIRSLSGLLGAFQCVVFTPEDLELSKGSPDIRRNFLDMSVSQIKASYRSVIEKYKRILEQRNLQLKQINAGRADDSMLDVWDVQLAQMGAYITVLRYNYSKKLQRTASELFKDISDGKEDLKLVYHSTVFDSLDGRNDYKGELFDEYLAKLSKSRNDDIHAGFTIHGVHRDDLKCFINALYAKDFASQGQHRSIALILKLSQAYILGQEIYDPPCILLDDVLSELDAGRQNFVMNKIDGMQVLITCCDEDIMPHYDGRLFIVDGGTVKQV